MPIVTTDVGGNAEVVSSPDVGILVPFGSLDALQEGIAAALEKQWDARAIETYVRRNTWEDRVSKLVARYRTLTKRDDTTIDGRNNDNSKA